MTNTPEPRWRIGPEILGFALFEPILLDPADVDDAGVVNPDERIMVSFFIKSHAVPIEGPPTGVGAFDIGILYEPIDDGDERMIEADLSIEGSAEQVCERLRTAIFESYENARENLYPTGVSTAPSS